MTTNEPEVVAYLHTDKEIPDHRGVSLHHDERCTNILFNIEPLIRLSDYEALKAENEDLREQLKCQAKAAQSGIDAAKKAGESMEI